MTNIPPRNYKLLHVCLVNRNLLPITGLIDSGGPEGFANVSLMQAPSLDFFGK